MEVPTINWTGRLLVELKVSKTDSTTDTGYFQNAAKYGCTFTAASLMPVGDITMNF
jgi:hypothetical protein